MFQDDYRRDIGAVGPSGEQMKRLMTTLEQGGEKTVKKTTLKTALVAAAVCAALAVTAFAASPWLREALGALQPYSQEIEGVAVVDQGIEVRAVSALSDGNSAQVYFEVTDLEGDRLSEFSRMKVEMDIPEETGWGSVGWSGANVQYYDPEKRTALMWFRMTGIGEPVEDLTLQVELCRLLPKVQYKEFPFPADVTFGERTLRSETLEEGRVVLKPGQTVRELEPGHMSISSCGFGADGRLHFLFAFEDESFDQTESRLDVFFSSKTDREPEYNNHSPQPVWFQRDGVFYQDVCYDITAKDLSDVTFERIEGWCASGETVDGHWRLEVPLENAPALEIGMAGTTVIGGVEAKTLYLTSLGATMRSDPHDSAGTLNFEMAVFAADGTVMTRAWCDDVFHTGNYVSNHWSFDEPIVPEKVAGISIGSWYVPIADGVAQPGHWLAELP